MKSSSTTYQQRSLSGGGGGFGSGVGLGGDVEENDRFRGHDDDEEFGGHHDEMSSSSSSLLRSGSQRNTTPSGGLALNELINIHEQLASMPEPLAPEMHLVAINFIEAKSIVYRCMTTLGKNQNWFPSQVDYQVGLTLEEVPNISCSCPHSCSSTSSLFF